jgi:hypothetical protein
VSKSNRSNRWVIKPSRAPTCCISRALDCLVGYKFGPDMGANRALDAFIWHCAQPVSVGAMRGVAESYYEARGLSYNRL